MKIGQVELASQSKIDLMKRKPAQRVTSKTALLAGGSYIHGGFDAHSALDFVVVVEKAHYSLADMAASELVVQGAIDAGDPPNHFDVRLAHRDRA